METCIKCGKPLDGTGGKAVRFDTRGHWIHESCLKGESK